MTADDLLAFIEGTNAYMDGITHIRDGLVDRGWSSPGAELAARELFAAMMSNHGGKQ